MAQPTVGTFTPETDDTGGNLTWTFNAVINAGSNFCTVIVCAGDGLTATTHNSVTIDGDACTKRDEQGDTNDTCGISFWTRDNPTTGGAVEVIVTVSADERVVIMVLPATGVDLAAPLGTIVKGENSTPGTSDAAPSLTPAGATDDLMLSFLHHRDGSDTTATEGANQAMVGDAASGTNISSPHGYISSEPFNTTSSSPVTMDYSMNNNELYVQIAVALKGLSGVDKAGTDTGTEAEDVPDIALTGPADAGSMGEDQGQTAAGTLGDNATLAETASIDQGTVAKSASDAFTLSEPDNEITSDEDVSEGTLTEGVPQIELSSRTDTASQTEGIGGIALGLEESATLAESGVVTTADVKTASDAFTAAEVIPGIGLSGPDDAASLSNAVEQLLASLSVSDTGTWASAGSLTQATAQGVGQLTATANFLSALSGTGSYRKTLTGGANVVSTLTGDAGFD